MVAAMYFSGHGHVSWLWLLVFFAVITLGELYFSPIGLALTARVAPAQILSTMMGFWLMTSFFGNLLQGYIGSYFSRMDKIHFFLFAPSVGAAAGVIYWLFNFPLKGILHQEPAAAGPGIHRTTPRGITALHSSTLVMVCRRIDKHCRQGSMIVTRRTEKPDTIAIHAGRMSEEHFGVVNTPVYRASTILYPDLAALECA